MRDARGIDVRVRDGESRPAPSCRVGSGGLGPAAAILRLQRRIGNRAVSGLLLRWPTGWGGGGGVRRTIVLDGSVFDQINRGNKAVADKLRELLRTEDVWIAHSAYEEQVTNRAIPRLGTATRLAVDELGIKITPAAKPADLADVKARNVLGKGKTVMSDEDLVIAAEAKSVDGEVFSPDRVFRSNANGVRKQLGVKVAFESETLGVIGGKGQHAPEQDYRVGRRLLGLKEVEISIGGNVKDPRPSGGGGKPGGEPPATPAKAPGAEPPVEPAGVPKVEPKTSGVEPEVAPRAPGGPRGGLVRGGLKLGGNILVMVVMYWISKKSAEAAQEHLQELIETKLEPAVAQALIEKADAIDKAVAKDSTRPVYANITADIDSEWTDSGIGHNETTHVYDDVRFVGMTFSGNNLSDRHEVAHDTFTPLFSDVTTVTSTERMTYSVLVFDPAYEGEKARRNKSWEEFTEKNPRWKLKPVTGEAAENLHKRRWLQNVVELGEWRVHLELQEWEKIKEAARRQSEERERAKQRRSRVEVIR
jgi:hypothetical protein